MDKRKGGQVGRLVSTDQLNTLLCVHLRPIKLLVSESSQGIALFGGGFALRCFQRLSSPHVATQQCR